MKKQIVIGLMMGLGTLAQAGFKDPFEPPTGMVPPALKPVVPAHKFLCRVQNYGAYATTGEVETRTFLHVSSKLATTIEVEGLKATVRTFDPQIGGRPGLRLVVDLRGELGNGQLAYTNVVIDDEFPRNTRLTMTVPDTNLLIGSLNCEHLK